MHASERWQRLAELLAARRARLNPEWADRTRFCSDTGLSYRSLSDLENGRRDNYSPAWLAKVERAYQLKPGAIRRYVNHEVDTLETCGSGAPSEPLASTQRPAEDSPSPQQDDWVEGVSWWPSRRDPALRVYRMRWLDANGRRHEYITEADREVSPAVIVEYLERRKSEAM